LNSIRPFSVMDAESQSRVAVVSQGVARYGRRPGQAVCRARLDKSGIKLIGPGDIADDEDLPGMSDAMIGTITAGFYSAYHPSDLNRDYVAAFRKANANVRPNFISVSAYDGMHLIYEALKTTGGGTNGDALVEAMKGMAWESPRGPMSIDPKTRDVVHDIRKIEKIGGELYSVEHETFRAIKDPAKIAKR
jgi:branched-chain amino acid transport system substrate-binding protein